jgi:hypothetical protein
MSAAATGSTEAIVETGATAETGAIAAIGRAIANAVRPRVTTSSA